MNALGYDLTTVGNHEWDNGVATLAKFWNQLKMPIVCANCVVSEEALLKDLVKPYHIFEDLGIAIIGYITPVCLFVFDLRSDGHCVLRAERMALTTLCFVH